MQINTPEPKIQKKITTLKIMFFVVVFFVNFLHLFILHLHCSTIFEDDDAICEIK